MTYNELNEKLTGRNKNGRKLANNTYAERRGDNIAIRLHSTDVLTFFPDGKIVVNSGGWKTVTTKDRINSYLPMPHRIHQEQGQWYWRNGVVFTDGDSIQGDTIHTQATPDQEKEAKALRKKVNAYARKYAESLPLPHPSGGDCWYCLQTTNGDTLGDATKNQDHILSHIEEGYIVPSLALNALKEGRCGDVIIHDTFSPSSKFGIAKTYLPRAVRKYVFKRLGMAA